MIAFVVLVAVTYKNIVLVSLDQRGHIDMLKDEDLPTIAERRQVFEVGDFGGHNILCQL